MQIAELLFLTFRIVQSDSLASQWLRRRRRPNSTPPLCIAILSIFSCRFEQAETED